MVPRVPAKSPYSFREKLLMTLWWFVEATLFRPSLHKMNRWRVFLLRIFGAQVGQNTFIHSKAKIWFPWNLSIGANAGIGFDALIYNLAPISIGDFATVSQRCHLNTGSHDYERADFPLITRPIKVGEGAFIGADTYVAWGTHIGEMAVIAARSVVTKDIPPYVVAAGHPCVPKRKFQVKQS